MKKFERSLKRVLLRGRGGEIAGVFVFLFLYWFCFCACVIVLFGNVKRLLSSDRGGEVAASSLSNEPLLMSVVTRPVKNFFKLSKYKKMSQWSPQR